MSKKTEKKGFSFNNLDTVGLSNAGAKVYIIDPTNDKPTSLYIEILGADSDAFKDKIDEFKERNKLLKLKSRNSAVEVSEKEIDARVIELMQVGIIGWGDDETGENSWEVDGNFLPCNPVNIELVFNDRRFSRIKDQVNTEINTLANFTNGNARTTLPNS